MTATRQGLRIKASKIDPAIRSAFTKFAKWLRQRYSFPVRVPVYLHDKEFVISKNKESCVSIFFAPYSNDVEPYIKIAVGDYSVLLSEHGRDEALFTLLYSMSVEVLKYQKWLVDNNGLDSYDATDDATELLSEYVTFNDTP
ncbi:hypothetical protein [Hahella sp. NBU794]|uniref:hypothetical protein n=1 Tax=Hahella sp. NBU794 TaxID=3422590 RepID=UPI003D6F88CE